MMAAAPPAILLDANLLLLLAVGMFDSSLIGRKRLDVFSDHDFDLLMDLIESSPRLITTPHVLTEVNNLAEQCVPSRRHRDLRRFLQSWIPLLHETWESASFLSATGAFAALGLADAAIANLAGDGILVLSVDLQRCVELWGRGVSVENFNHLRDQ